MIKTATLTIFHTMNDGSHAVQHMHGIDVSRWDTAVMEVRDILRNKAASGHTIVAAELRCDDRAPNGAALGKVYQPGEWAVAAHV